ncbi:hypothetical protein pb186bvf_015184 [Paramecium bursaria]
MEIDSDFKYQQKTLTQQNHRLQISIVVLGIILLLSGPIIYFSTQKQDQRPWMRPVIEAEVVLIKLPYLNDFISKHRFNYKWAPDEYKVQGSNFTVLDNYAGEHVKGKPHGQGMQILENLVVEGYFAHGTPIYGALYFQRPDLEGQVVIGPIQGRRVIGYGWMTYSYGIHYYIGDIVNNLREGKGFQLYNNYQSYQIQDIMGNGKMTSNKDLEDIHMPMEAIWKDHSIMDQNTAYLNIIMAKN